MNQINGHRVDRRFQRNLPTLYRVPKPTLVLSDVSKRHRSAGGTTVALHETTLEFFPQALTLITGPSGSGKSTLLQLLAGVDWPSSGSIESFGMARKYTGDAIQYHRANCGLIFQDLNLILHLCALENVVLSLLAQRGTTATGNPSLVRPAKPSKSREMSWQGTTTPPWSSTCPVRLSIAASPRPQASRSSRAILSASSKFRAFCISGNFDESSGDRSD